MTDQAKKHQKQQSKTVRKRQPARQADQDWAELKDRPDPALLQHAIVDPAGASPGDILNLQRDYGNQAVSGLIQAKLQVGPVGDQYEQEADRVAEKVMSMPAPSEAEGAAPGGGEGVVQREIEAEEEELLQAKSLAQRSAKVGSGFEADPEIERRIADSRRSGRPLPDELRTDMEARFGANFVDVRVHADGQAAELNRELNARAFTHGRDIYFKEGEYDPGSSAGQRLLAHELTHVVQQTGGGTRSEGARPVSPSKAQVTPGPAVVQRQVWKDLGYASEEEWQKKVPRKERMRQQREWFEKGSLSQVPQKPLHKTGEETTKKPPVKKEQERPKSQITVPVDPLLFEKEKKEKKPPVKKEQELSKSLSSLPLDPSLIKKEKGESKESDIPKPPPMKKEFKFTEEQEGQFFERQKALRETELRGVGQRIKKGEGHKTENQTEFEKKLEEKRGALKRRTPRREISLNEEQESKFFESRREEREAELEQLRKDVKSGKTEVSEGVGTKQPTKEDLQSLKAPGRKGKSSFEKQLIKGKKKLSPRRDVIPKPPPLPEGKTKPEAKDKSSKRSWLDRFRRRKKQAGTTETTKGSENKEPQDRGLKPRGFDPMEQKPPEPKFLSTEVSKEEPKKEEAKSSGMESMMGGMMGGMMGAMMVSMMGKGTSQGPDVGNLSGQVKDLETRIKKLEEQLK
jgi:hypothetical protein